VSRFALIVPLLLLAAAAPEVPPAVTPPAPPATTPPAPTAATAPSAATLSAPTPPAPSAPTPPAPSAATPPAPPAATTPPAAPPAAATAKPPATGPKMPPTVALQKVAPEEAMPILGHLITGPNGKDIARLVDVLVDPDGQPVAAVLDFGGFMGVGTRKIAVHWSALHFDPAATAQRITLSLTQDEIKAAPEYKGETKTAPVVVRATPGSQPAP